MCPPRRSRRYRTLFADGRRVVAVASQTGSRADAPDRPDESGLTLDGFLVFADNPKTAARDSLTQLAALGIEVKIATGDNPRVAEKVCAELGLTSKGTATGAQLEQHGRRRIRHRGPRADDLRAHLPRAESPADLVAAARAAAPSVSSATV